MSFHSYSREGLSKHQQLLNKEKMKAQSSVLLSELKNEQMYMKKERTYWTIGEEVILLKYAKYAEKEQKEIAWENLKPKLKKKDTIECRKRFEEIRKPKFGEYEKPEDIIDKSWDQIKESILIFGYLKYQGNFKKIQKRLNEFTQEELEVKMQEIKQKNNFDKHLGILNEYNLIDCILKKQKINKLEKKLNKSNEDLLKHLEQVIENFRVEKQIEQVNYFSNSEQDYSQQDNYQYLQQQQQQQQQQEQQQQQQQLDDSSSYSDISDYISNNEKQNEN